MDNLTDFTIGNIVNSSLTDEFLKSMAKELSESMFDEFKELVIKYATTIPFVNNLTSPNRPRLKNLKRYKNPNALENELEEDTAGKIIVNLENPHILENMDYFRETRLYYEKHGRFTNFKNSRNPKSPFKQFWKKEIYRCWNGMLREEDGEWISGYNYFYWNFGIILKVIIDKNNPRKGHRIEGPPTVYDGDYWFFHYIEKARDNGRHSSVLKARGLGYSFKAASMLCRNFVLGESADACIKTNNMALANEKEYLIKDAVLNKFVDNIDYLSKVTPFPRRRDAKDTLNGMHWVMSYFKGNGKVSYGTKNQVMGVSLKNDPEKARGKRSNLIIWEEAGKFDCFLKAWGIARPSVEHNNLAFGLMLAFGTGGTEGAAFEGLKEIVYNPLGYNIEYMQNVFDTQAGANSVSSFFHGRYLNYEGCMDENGNSDVLKALCHIIKSRLITKYNAKKAETLPQLIAENPITIQESIMQTSGNNFPVLEIRNRLEEIRSNLDNFTSTHSVGKFVLGKNNSEVFWDEDFSLKPIRTYTSRKSDLEGAVELFKKPVREKDNSILPFRYIAGIDPVDNDYVLNGSLGSIFIFDLFTDEIVAEYSGRPKLAEDFYEICRRLLIYYNATANYESNIKGLFGYFKNKNSLNLLCETPSWLKDAEMVRRTLGGTISKGTRATTPINDEADSLQRSWLLTDFTDNDGLDEISILNVKRIRSLGYLEELFNYNKFGNFDRVRAMGMLMIYRKELSILTEGREKRVDYNLYIEEDEFISSNYEENGEIFKIFND